MKGSPAEYGGLIVAGRAAQRGKMVMQVYRSPMEKLLKQMEDNEVITNPKQALRSLLHKIGYRCCYHIDRLIRATRHIFHRH